MLDLAVGRKMLRKFLLCNDGDRGVGAKQNGAGRCRALVDGKDVSGHAFPLNFFGGWVQTNSHQREAACASEAGSEPTRMTANPGGAPDRATRRCTRRRQSSRIVRATALPSMIFAVMSARARSKRIAGLRGAFGEQRSVTSNFALLARHFNPEHNES